MVCNTKSVPMLRLIERRALAQLNSTRTFVALGFFPALLAREVCRRRYLRLWQAVRDGALPEQRKYALIGRGPGVDPASQERTYFDCLAAVDTFRENDDLSLALVNEDDDTQLDRLLAQLDTERPPVQHLDEWNCWQERRYAAICQLAGKAQRRLGERVYTAEYVHGGRSILRSVTLTMGASGWLSLALQVEDLGVNEYAESDDTSTDPAMPVVEWEHGVARKERRHPALPSVDIDFAEVEIKVHQWWTAIEHLDQQAEMQVDVIVDGTQSRYEDLVLYTGYISEGLTATLNVGEPLC